MELLTIFEQLFTFDSYWKIAVLVIGLGAGLAFFVTGRINKYGKRKRAGEPDPSWWSIMLRGVACALGTGIGLAVDYSATPLIPEGVEASAPLMSALLGFFSGAFCATIVWKFRTKILGRKSTDPPSLDA